MIQKVECYKCLKVLAENLVLPKGLCVYCAADESDRLPDSPKQKAEVQKKQVQESLNIKAEQELASRILSRKRLLPFVEKFNPDYQAGWVHKDICKRLEKFSDDVANKKSPRLMLFMPPRHGKSTLASIAFPAWHIGRHPHQEFISCSYSGSLSMTFSRKVRQLLRDPLYKKVFEKTRLDADSQSIESWLTTSGGGYVAAGVGGGITGKGAHVLVIDDPVKNREDAESENNRESTWDLESPYTP